MEITNIPSILQKLRSCDPDSQMSALDEFFSLPTSVSESDRRIVLLEAIRALGTSTNPYVIAERVLRFGTDAIAPLIDLLTRAQSSEVKTLASLILINNQSDVGKTALIEEIRREGPYRVMASFALANAGFSDHVPLIVQKLRQYEIVRGCEFPSNDDGEMISFFEVLNQLRVQLPDDIKQKYSGSEAPRFFWDSVKSL